MFKHVRDYFSDNAIQGDAAEAEAALRKIHSGILQKDEKVVFAFLDRGGSGRDSSYFTSKRILIRDVKGVTGNRQNYKTILYKDIDYFSASTPGPAMIDSDAEIDMYVSGMGHIEFEFSRDKVDIFAIKSFLNRMVLPAEVAYTVQIPQGVGPGMQFQATLEDQVVVITVPPNLGPGYLMQVLAPPKEYSQGEGKDKDPDERHQNIFDFLGDNAAQVDAKMMEDRLRTSPPVLHPGEKIALAFKSGRDFKLFTNKRLMVIDKRGLTGKKVMYRSFLWKMFHAFEVETAGSFLDRDAEIRLFTNHCPRSIISQDLRNGKCDVMEVQKFLTDKILGFDFVPPLQNFQDAAHGKVDTGSGSVLAFLGDDNRQIDAAQANAQFHTNPAILQGSEFCEMAFKGRRDLVLFTNKRIVIIDTIGFTGKRKSFKSLPWKSIVAFSVTSAGSFVDKDSELTLWTEMMYYQPPSEGDNPPPPPVPVESMISLDFQKDKVDLMSVQRYVASRVLLNANNEPPNPEAKVPDWASIPTNQSGIEALGNFIGQNNKTMDPKEFETQMKAATILQEDEFVAMAFQVGRDSVAFTNKRVLNIDVQGFTGKRIEYKSLPYSSIRAWHVETAGTIDWDTELRLYTRNPWMGSFTGCMQFDFKKKTDIIAIGKYLSAMIFGVYDYTPKIIKDEHDAKKPETKETSGFMQVLTGDGEEINAESASKKYREEVELLLDSEVVDAAFKCGRDKYVHTNKRFISIDIKGISGKRRNYFSLPLKYCTGFAAQTAGSVLDRDSELYVYTDISGFSRFKQTFRKTKVDVLEQHEKICNKLIR